LDLTLLADPNKNVIRQFTGTNLFGMAHRKSFLIDPFGKLRQIYNVGDFKSANSKRHAEEVVRDLEVLMDLVTNLGTLEIKNREILDSINSASRIQAAVLPDLDKTTNNFLDFSLLWAPRDIVGGDCYWSIKFENKIWFGLFDCTGHGVPGAFVSLILLSKLMRIFQEAQNETERLPSNLLYNLDLNLRDSLSQDNSVGLRDDGADGAIIQWELGSSEIIFAGANMPILIQQGLKLKEIKGVRRSIGYRKNRDLSEFIDKNIDINDQTRLFIYTDGVTDEGRELDGLAFGKNRLKSFLSKSGELTLSELNDGLKNELEKWRQKRPRRDDITFVSIKLI
jgi:serine phosphatase RsbU (regulator of sigma subunit)